MTDNWQRICNEFIEVACAINCALIDRGHEDQLRLAKRLLRENPGLTSQDFYAAAVCGDVGQVKRFLQANPELATLKGGPRNWDALLYLCFSRLLRTPDPVPNPSERILKTARLLLEAGADPNSYFMLGNERETALYAACGVCNNAALAGLLLSYGADVNDEDASYHVAEFENHDCIRVLFQHGIDADRRATVLLRKLDFDDIVGVRAILELGCDPNHMGVWGKTALHQAIMRGRDLDTIKLLLKHGADPIMPRQDGATPLDLACQFERPDVVELLKSQGATGT